MMDLTRSLPYLLPGVVGYAFGAIPFAYIVVKMVTGEDITRHGTGNVGSMNVRRTTGSWAWFVVNMLLDIGKGAAAVLLVRYWLSPALGLDWRLASQIAVVMVVVGHDWPITMYLITGKMHGGKGLAAGGGALFVLNMGYALVGLFSALAFIAITRVLLVGQLASGIVFLIYVALLHPEDTLFAAVLCALVVVKHAARVPGLIHGKEPTWNVTDERGRRNRG
jgi:glycerol-3-phosphate acyltransferase PlsY